jgi:hypothetical protein
MLASLEPYSVAQIPTLADLLETQNDMIFFLDSKEAILNLTINLQQFTDWKWYGTTPEEIAKILSEKKYFKTEGVGIRLGTEYFLNYADPSFYKGSYPKVPKYYLDCDKIKQIFADTKAERIKQISLDTVL